MDRFLSPGTAKMKICRREKILNSHPVILEIPNTMCKYPRDENGVKLYYKINYEHYVNVIKILLLLLLLLLNNTKITVIDKLCK